MNIKYRTFHAGLLAVVSTAPLLHAAMIRDEFDGRFTSSLAWRWDVPGNTPVDTKDDGSHGFSPTTLDIGMLNGSLFEGQNNIRNVANVAIISDPGSAWAVTTSVFVNWTSIPDRGGRFPQAGLIFFSDADNYMTFIHNWNGTFGPSGAQVSTNCEAARTNIFCGGDSDGIPPTGTFWGLRVPAALAGFRYFTILAMV